MIYNDKICGFSRLFRDNDVYQHITYSFISPTRLFKKLSTNAPANYNPSPAALVVVDVFIAVFEVRNKSVSGPSPLFREKAQVQMARTLSIVLATIIESYKVIYIALDFAWGGEGGGVRSEGREERSFTRSYDRILHSTIINILLLVACIHASLLASSIIPTLFAIRFASPCFAFLRFAHHR